MIWAGGSTRSTGDRPTGYTRFLRCEIDAIWDEEPAMATGLRAELGVSPSSRRGWLLGVGVPALVLDSCAHPVRCNVVS
jgi:hypothetical protein